MSMDHDREEHNPQQPRGRNGVGSSRGKNLEISEGNVSKQRELKGGRPRLELSEEQDRKRKDKHNASCQKSRAKRDAEIQRLKNFENVYREEFGSWSPTSLKVLLRRHLNITKMLLGRSRNLEAELQRLKNFENEYQEVFRSLSPKSLKELLFKLGVTEEVLEGERKGTPWEELRKVWQTSKGEMVEDMLDEDKEKRTINSEEFLEWCAKCLSEDEGTEESLEMGNEDLTKTYKEFEALIGKSPTPGSKNVAMNEPTGLNGVSEDAAMDESNYLENFLPTDDWLASNSSEVSEDAAMDEPIDLEKFPPISDYLSSIGSGETLQSRPVLSDRVNHRNLIAPTGWKGGGSGSGSGGSSSSSGLVAPSGPRASEQAKEHEPVGMEPAVVQHASQDNISKAGEKEALTCSAAAPDQECNIPAGIGKRGEGNSSSRGRSKRVSRESNGSLSKKRNSYGQRKLAPKLSKKRELRS